MGTEMENNIDFQVDETLEKCILSTPRKSFFLFAGAGSGKTYSLVLLLKKIHNSIGKDLLLQGKNVAVITFTNAATDEIINRLDYSPIFHISTIHSFVWDVIKYYQADIKRLYLRRKQRKSAACSGVRSRRRRRFCSGGSPVRSRRCL